MINSSLRVSTVEEKTNLEFSAGNPMFESMQPRARDQTCMDVEAGWIIHNDISS